jgi:proteasome accessory factor B
VSRRRTERLVNLVICLLSTRRFLTAAQIARTVPGYEHDQEDPKEHEAFQRMFERDKAELRELGVPVETGTTSAFDTEPGYRIAERDYALPDIHLAPDEAAAVGLAARLWQSAGLASAASSALLKLRAAGIDVDPQTTLGVEPVVAGEPAVDVLLAAARVRRAVRFAYRGSHDDEPAIRNLQPWGVVSWHGRWYVVGHDTDRNAQRCFRLSRVAGVVKAVGREGVYTPPENPDLLATVASLESNRPDRGDATVRIRRGAAAGLRRSATTVVEGSGADPASPESWDVATVRYSDPDSLARRLAGYGSDVVVTGPPEVRDAVVHHLRAVAGAGAGAAR